MCIQRGYPTRDGLIHGATSAANVKLSGKQSDKCSVETEAFNDAAQTKHHEKYSALINMMQIKLLQHSFFVLNKEDICI